MKAFLVAAIAVFALIQLRVEPSEAAINCLQVDGYLKSCIPYLTMPGVEPSNECCKGLQGLVDAAQTTADKRGACDCVEKVAKNFPNLQDDAAKALPTKCKVALNIPISRDFDCSLIN